MTRHRLTPRPDWETTVRSQGLAWHHDDADTPYWDESTAYELNEVEVGLLEEAAAEVHQLYIEATDHVIQKNRWADLGIAPAHVPLMKQSWAEDEFTLYGRFDMVLDRWGQPILLEYNADTPTALLEASVIQWHWLKDVKPGCDQWNGIHERLIAAWQRFPPGKIHFASVADAWEDEITAAYLEDTAGQAGRTTTRLPMAAIGWDAAARHFTDEDDAPIQQLFKLYPWEWMLQEEFGRHIHGSQCRFLEPPWKHLWSNKAMLAILWELFPSHPALLPCYRDAGLLGPTYVKKPVFSREGANITIIQQGKVSHQQDGPYGSEGYIYQALAENESIDGAWPVLGVWMIDGEPAGLGIREDTQRITANASRFVPHWIQPPD
jgi:glutathionylspermidine synthase